MADVLEFRQVGHVCHLTLQRPEKLNALCVELLDGLEAAFEELEHDGRTRAVVIAGAGRAFCVGADLDEVTAALEDDRFDAFLTRWHQVFARIESSPLPTFAAVHGVALAGGFELLQVCDFVAVADDARVGDQHARLGLFPGGGSTQRLPRQIGWRRAKWLTMSGEWIDAQTAFDWGLANWVFPRETLIEEVLKLAARQARRSAHATAAIKKAIQCGSGLPLSEAIRVDQRLAVAHMRSADARGGLSAFAAGNQPEFVRQEDS